MKYSILPFVLLLPVSVVAAENCVPVYESPVSFTVSAKQGKTSMSSYNDVVRGNEHSPIQPAETLHYRAGNLSFSIMPVQSCEEGIKVELTYNEMKTQHFVPWDKQRVISGKINTDQMIVIESKRIKKL